MCSSSTVVPGTGGSQQVASYINTDRNVLANLCAAWQDNASTHAFQSIKLWTSAWLQHVRY